MLARYDRIQRHVLKRRKNRNFDLNLAHFCQPNRLEARIVQRSSPRAVRHYRSERCAA